MASEQDTMWSESVVSIFESKEIAGAFQLLDAKRREIATAREYVDTQRTHWHARIRLESMLMGRMPRGGYALDTISIAASGGASQMSGSGGH